MKRKIAFWIIILLCIGNAKIKPVQAYTVTVQKEGMYAEVVPETYLNNVAAIFRKSVSNSLKYYNKYKDASPVTYNRKMPAEYRDFVNLARKIKASDKIVISDIFYIYDQWDRLGKGGSCKYYFVVQKNGKKFCLFQLTEDIENGEIVFWYDKVMDQYFEYDDKLMAKAIFYASDSVTYAQTSDKIYVVRNQKDFGNMGALTAYDTEIKRRDEEFNNKNYNEKKDEIFSYLAKAKKDGISRKTEKNLKLELKDDYIESESDGKHTGIRKPVYLTVGGTLLTIVAIILVVRKRKKASGMER